MKLLLGVNDVAYTDKEGIATTGQVAEYLENDYGVMRVFAESYGGFIGDQLGESIAGAIESISHGKPGEFDVFGPMTRIEEKFRVFLDRGEWQQISGQRIAAAEAGVSHRRKRVYKKRKSRRAFIDTGLYQASFRAWLSD